MHFSNRPGFAPLQLSTEQLCTIIERTSWAFDFSWQELETLIQHSRSFKVKKGRQLFKQGDREPFMCLISQGSVSIHKEPKQLEDPPLAILTQGQSLGEMSLLDHEPRSATAVARQELVIHVLTADQFDTLQANHPRLWGKIMEKIARQLSQRLRRTSGTLVDLL